MTEATKLDHATLLWCADQLEHDARSLRRYARKGELPEHTFADRAALLEGYVKRLRSRATRVERKAGKGDG